MSINCKLISISDINIKKLIAFPPLIWKVTNPESADTYIKHDKETIDFFKKKYSKSNKESIKLPDLDFTETENETVNILKFHEGINFCLVCATISSDFSLNFIAKGGKRIGDIEVRLGPARAIKSPEVKTIYQQLKLITPKKLKKQYRPSLMEKHGVYPHIWERDGDRAFKPILENFLHLKEFVANCNKNKLGMIIYYH